MAILYKMAVCYRYVLCVSQSSAPLAGKQKRLAAVLMNSAFLFAEND
jgi:hypothetical protein